MNITGNIRTGSGARMVRGCLQVISGNLTAIHLDL